MLGSRCRDPARRKVPPENGAWRRCSVPSWQCFGHDHEPGREWDQPLHHAPLVCFRLTQNGMKRCDNRHSQFAQERQDLTTGGPAVNAELVLQADDVDVADVEEVRGTQIGRQVLLLNLEANYFRVLVATLNVVDRHCEALVLGMRACDGSKQVRRERSNAALAWRVVANKSNLADFRSFFHEAFPLQPCARLPGSIGCSRLRYGNAKEFRSFPNRLPRSRWNVNYAPWRVRRDG